ncbi:MAG: MarR family winged helix-turn-helix transcriptional regulator [Bacteriovoracia bacterium]
MLSRKILTSIPRAIRTLRKLSVGILKNDLTFQQFRILMLASEGMGQTQMSQTMQVSMAAVSKIVDQLVKKGLLIREAGADRRCYHLKPSREGEKIRKKVESEVGRQLERQFKKLSNKEQKELEKGLEVLNKLMGLLNDQ